MNPTPVTCNDNAPCPSGMGMESQVQWNAVVGQIYFIGVMGKNGQSGSFSLMLQGPP